MSDSLLRDSHMTPEPILVVSALCYLFPTYSILSTDTKGRLFDVLVLLLLTISSIGFHATRLERWFALDLCSITIFIVRFAYLSTQCSPFAQFSFVLSMAYCFISYFVGKMYRMMSFDPDWSTQMLFHSMMHLTTALSAYFILADAADAETAAETAAETDVAKLKKIICINV